MSWTILGSDWNERLYELEKIVFVDYSIRCRRQFEFCVTVSKMNLRLEP